MMDEVTNGGTTPEVEDETLTDEAEVALIPCL